jgi:hypothetical protein
VENIIATNVMSTRLISKASSVDAEDPTSAGVPRQDGEIRPPSQRVVRKPAYQPAANFEMALTSK